MITNGMRVRSTNCRKRQPWPPVGTVVNVRATIRKGRVAYIVAVRWPDGRTTTGSAARLVPAGQASCN